MGHSQPCRRFDGSVTVVTGAGGGIGRAIAVGFGAEGAAVACLDLDGESAEATAAQIRSQGVQAFSVVCDASVEVDVEAALAATAERLGPVDVLVANAGGSRGQITPFLELTVEDWQAMVDRNLTTTFVSSLVVSRQMVARQTTGAIVVVSSQLSETVRPGMAAYCSAKGGVRQLIRAMAVDLAPHGVRVNGIAPGPTMTPGNRAWFEHPDVDARHREAIPLGRIAQADELVGGALYLASSDASFTIGTTLMVDGGYTIV